MIDIKFTIDLSEMRRLAKDHPEAYEEAVEEMLKEVTARMETEVVERTPKGVGGIAGLMGSIHGEVVRRGRTISATVGTPLEHGPVVELGRRPGKAMPPIDPIRLWARRKLGVGAEEARSVGFVIARKIAVHGFEGAHMFERSMQALDPWIMAQTRKIPERIAKRLGGTQ